MRDTVLDSIDQIREHEGGFPAQTMRWSKYYLVPNKGLRYLGTRKEKGLINPPPIILEQATRNDFDTLEDMNLLECYTTLIRISSKQM